MASPTDKPAPAADDLVKRLRKWAKVAEHIAAKMVCDEAADRIEALSPTLGADDEALIQDAYSGASGSWEALRRRIAGLRARVFDLETQADDRRHENNALRNTNDLLSEVIEEADDEVELIQDLICAPMEKKRAKGIAIRDYIQSMRSRAEAAERELAACKQELANVDNARLAVLAAMRPIPAGWRLVPVELTDDMIAAFLREFQRHPKHFETAKIWAAMLAAAPEAPLEDTTVADRLAAARGLLNSIDGPEAPR